ncbi:solute carrier family 25 protein [archaeon]|nr:MAG: solute carrier family 25 protein [archaeon]
MDNIAPAATIDSYQNLKDAVSDVLASVAGSFACTYTGQPFDTIKVRMQVQPADYRGISYSLIRIVQKEGLTALWKGATPAFLGALSENAVAFAINGLLTRALPWPEDSPFRSVLTGGATGIFAAFALCPLDVIKCRAQVGSMGSIVQGVGVAGSVSRGPMHSSSTSTWGIGREILRAEGMRGLFRGLSAQVARDVLFFAAFFGAYDLARAALRKHTAWSDGSVYFVAGG